MLNSIKKAVPLFVKKGIGKKIEKNKLKKNYKQDMDKFIRYSFSFGKEKTQRHYEADLIFYYHKLEKGLSLPAPRIGFGEKNVKHLLDILEAYVKKYGWDNVSKISLNTLNEYYHFNKKNNLKLDNIFKRIKKLEKTIPDDILLTEGGVNKVTKEEIEKNRNINFRDFSYSRHSIRNFAPGEISMNIIEEAVYMAQKTPSVCNRQTSKVYVYSDSKLKEAILKYQNGNVGFGDKANKILVVTSELKDYRGIIERNQSYIDGGMYAMSLIYALHSLGVGTCPLNLSITNETEKRLKQVARIGDSEVLLMMIAIGNLPEELNVASSPRRNVEEVLTIY